MIRITGGENRSRLLETPNTTLTKPTMDKVRAGVFSALGDAVSQASVLDLFAGSGSYGFEALSRGAKDATFVELNRETAKVIQRNANSLKRENITIKIDDVLPFLSGKADPPLIIENHSKYFNMFLILLQGSPEI